MSIEMTASLSSAVMRTEEKPARRISRRKDEKESCGRRETIVTSWHKGGYGTQRGFVASCLNYLYARAAFLLARRTLRRTSKTLRSGIFLAELRESENISGREREREK